MASAGCDTKSIFFKVELNKIKFNVFLLEVLQHQVRRAQSALLFTHSKREKS